jgi:predicted DNA-binding transcriptional regulator AlpA
MIDTEISNLHLLDAASIQQITGLSRSRAYEILTEIPTVRLGASKLCRASDLEMWIESHIVEPGQRT